MISKEVSKVIKKQCGNLHFKLDFAISEEVAVRFLKLHIPCVLVTAKKLKLNLLVYVHRTEMRNAFNYYVHQLCVLQLQVFLSF